MWTFVTQTGLATAGVDFTHDLSLLGVGLISLLTLSALSIAFVAVRQHLAQESTPVTSAVPVPADYRAAA
jgi:hypothetical protein